MVQQNSQQAWHSAGKTDSINSTFKHIAWMDSKSKKKIIPVPGYSKPWQGKESYDKTIHLERELCRLIKNGYIFGLHHKYKDKTVCFEIFLNGNYSGIADEKIVTLFPTHYEFANNKEWIENIRFNGFLQRLYAQAKQGSFDFTKLIHKGKPYTEADLFNWSAKRFKTIKQLYEYCDQLRRDGYESDRVYNFMLKYTAQHPFKAVKTP